MLEIIKVQGGWIFMVILENWSDFYSGLSMEGLEAAPDPPFGSIGTVGTAIPPDPGFWTMALNLLWAD